MLNQVYLEDQLMRDSLTSAPLTITRPQAKKINSKADISAALEHSKLVSLCYQLLLGRLPENEKIVKARKNQSAQDIVRELIKSSEFRAWATSSRFLNKTVITNAMLKGAGDLLAMLKCQNKIDYSQLKSFSYPKFVDCVLLAPGIVDSSPTLIAARATYFANHSLDAKERLPENVLLHEELRKVFNAFFDLGYYAQNTKIKFDNTNSAAEHYLSLPIHDRKDPSRYFVRHLYRALYPIVSSLEMDSLVHYVCIGRFKDCNPHPLFDVQTVKNQVSTHTLSEGIYLDFLSQPERFLDVHFNKIVEIGHVRKYLGQNASSLEIFSLFCDPDASLDINPTPLFDVSYYEATGGCSHYRNALIDYLLIRSNHAGTHPLFDDSFYSMNVGKDLGGRPPLQHYLENWQKFPGDTCLFVDAKYLNHQLNGSPRANLPSGIEPLGYLLEHRIDFAGQLFHPHIDTRMMEAAFSNLFEGDTPQGQQLASVLLNFGSSAKMANQKALSSPVISIIILNYYKPVYSAICIMAALNSFRSLDVEVILIENGGEGFHFELLVRMFSQYPCFVAKKLSSNSYFGEGNNIGIDVASGDNVLFLNNDCFLLPDYGEAAVSLLQGGGHDALGALMMYPDGTIQEFGGLVADDGQVVQRAKGMPVEFLHTSSIEKVEYISAACFLISHKALEVVVGFDPLFEPFYYEDTDFCRRLRSADLTLAVSSSLKAIHIENASTREYLDEVKFQKMVRDHRALYARRWLRNSGVGAYTRKAKQIGGTGGTDERPTAVIFTPFGIRPGGGERYVFSAARALSKTHRIVICSPEIFSRARVEFLLNSLDIQQFAFDVCDFVHLKSAVPDVDIWFVMANEVVTALPACGRVNIYHLQFPFPWRNTNSFQFDVITSYDAIVVNSEFTRYWTERRLGEIGISKNPPVEVVYPPVKSIPAMRMRKIDGTLRIVTVGRFFVGGHSKRQDTFIKILARAREVTSQRIFAVILGSVHPSVEAQSYFEEILEAADELGDVQVVTEASNEEIVEHLNAADVYVHCTGYGISETVKPEEAEHFGITIVEAIRAGCIPLVYGVGGPAEIIQNSRAGLTFKSVDEAAGLLVSLGSDEHRTDLRKAVDWDWIERTSETAFDDRLLSIVQRFEPEVLSAPLKSAHRRKIRS